MASEKVYNWGIIGCGSISFDFTSALKKSSRCKVVSCGARQLEKAKNFAKQFDIPIYAAYDNYDAVSKDPNVDIVYIGTIHPSHYKSVVAALNNGKHVLCEKPIGMNVAETSEMVEAARKNNKFLMEAMWTRFFPAYRKARELIENGVIGDIRHYYGDFGIAMPSPDDAPRIWLNKLGGGGILDIGCYPINPLSWIFGPKLPKKINSTGIIDPKHNIDTIMGVTLIYNDKQYAQISTTFYGNTFQERLITGTKGKIRIEAPSHCPTKITLYQHGTTPETARDDVSVKTWEFKVPYNYKTMFPGSEGLVYEIDEVVQCLDEGRIESPNYTHNEILSTMKIMDEIRKQMGLRYPQDDNDNIKSKL